MPWSRFLRPLVLVAALLGGGAEPRAQSGSAVNPDDILYILPTIAKVNGSMASEYLDLRSRLGEGPYVKVGFTIYINVSMTDWSVDVTDRAAVRAKLAGTIQDIDAAIDTARQGGYPIALSLLCAIRERYDPVQRASEDEDRRNMMWYSDNALAPGWWTHSRYARKQLRIQEAYMREIGRVLADRMARYPDTVVAVSGDGEVELALGRVNNDPALTVYADYSPFAVAEFRDWIRAGGLYATGQPFAGQAYADSGRYAGDSSPAVDTNGDGHTFNVDFGASFSTWDLKYFDWKLTDTETQRAIPSTAAFDPGAISNPAGFDAPRVRGVKPAGYFGLANVDYWKLWLMFRSAMLQRHNTEVAKWMTTSPSVDAGTAGSVLSKTRWSSYQIPGDYLFNGSPANPNGRYESSGSSWTTADVSPYGSAGFTSFNLNFNCDPTKPTGAGGPQSGCGGPNPYFLTFQGLGPAIAARQIRFSLLEWHPSARSVVGVVPPENPFLFSNELALVEKYRPTVLSPFIWNDETGLYPIKGTGTEIMLSQLVADLKDGLPSDPRLSIDGGTLSRRLAQPFTLTGVAYDLGKVRGSGRDTGIDTVTVRATPVGGGSAIVLTGTTYGEPRADVSSARGEQFGPSGWRRTVQSLDAGTYDFVASGHSTVTGLTTSSAPVRITVLGPGLSVDHQQLRFGGVRNGSAVTTLTAAQDVLLSQPGVPSGWTATANQPWVLVSPAAGAGTKTVRVSINPSAAPPPGGSQAAVTFTANDGLADPVTVAITVVMTDAGGPVSAPAGSFDTPVDGSTVSGSIALTGWALDDIEVAKVELWRDAHTSDPAAARFGGGDARGGKVFIGNASFVEGARPDVEGLSPNTPRNYRAGWGYIMLTRGLIWDGKGPFKVHAFAFDLEGNMAALGSKTITIDNASSAKPFGAIDTPGQGDTVSGIINNFGWVVPSKGATIGRQNVQVFIDNVFVGNPGGLSRRADLDAAFEPLGFDTSQANRVLVIDTTQFANGVHTIGWLVTDSSGAADGVGSRFIRIQNTALSSSSASSSRKR
jgi:Big-like domain-containing protein